MRDMNLSQEHKDRILGWMFILLMRLYGQNVYTDESYIYKVFECESIEDVDIFFNNVLADFKTRHRDIAKLEKIKAKTEDVLSR